METTIRNVNNKTMLEDDDLRQCLMIEILKLTPEERKELLSMWKGRKSNGKYQAH